MTINSKFLIVAIFFATGIYFNSFGQYKTSEIEVLSTGADVILTGIVIEQSSSWNEDKTRIYTQATLQVDEFIKGEFVESSVNVKYPGGEVGEIGETYSHMPTFEDGEEVLVFLTKDNNSSDYRVYNGENGKIRLITDQQNGEKVTTSNVRISSLKSQIKSYLND